MLTSEITSNAPARDGEFTSGFTSAVRFSSTFASRFTSVPRRFPTSVHTSDSSRLRLRTSESH